ncbi:HAD family hydrolase [Micromonospora haikouensis]|uniref:HAD family hydrolase n=1 Tax=Micromonospora haikouensis TaxID=686309 RepID=UPI0037B2DFD9
MALDFGGTLATPGASPRGRDVVAALEGRLGWPIPAGLGAAVEEARAEAKAAYRRGVQTPWDSILAAAWRRVGADVPNLAEVVEALWETVPDAVVDPRAADVVWTLHRARWRLVLACNTQRPIAYRRRTLATAGLADCLDALVLSSDIGVPKPDPRFYAAVAEAAGVAPESVLFVGDTLDKDVIGPRAFGMRAVLVCDEPPPNLPEGVPVIAHLAELPGLLERWP